MSKISALIAMTTLVHVQYTQVPPKSSYFGGHSRKLQQQLLVEFNLQELVLSKGSTVVCEYQV